MGEDLSPREKLRQLDESRKAGENAKRPGQRKVSKQKRRRDQVRIAAALGTGAALREVAEEVGLSKTMVVHVRNKIEAGKDPHLANVFRKAQEEIAEMSIDALKPAILAAKQKAQDPETRGSDVAQIIRALGERVDKAAYVPLEPGSSAPSADVGALAGRAAAELLIALKEHEEKHSRPEREISGERVD